MKMPTMHRNRSVDVHQFAMVPKADIPRSSFRMQKGHKTTFDAGYLVPVYCAEILPGDTFNLKMTVFARLSPLIFPLMDNAYLESFFFFVPNRLVWFNWVKMMGEQTEPGDSISFTIPQTVSPAGGWAVGSVFDYFGIPTVGQIEASSTVSINALPLRGYNLIWNQWFRDENLQNSRSVFLGNGPDDPAAYTLMRRGKRHDYFTSCLPWTQKGNTPITIPLAGSAPVITGAEHTTGGGSVMLMRNVTGAQPGTSSLMGVGTVGGVYKSTTAGTISHEMYPTNLYADLTAATGATINQLRQSFQIQKLLERDARGGTRYTEIVRSHFGVVSPDARLQRPEYLGGGSSPVHINPVAQTSATGLDGGTAPLANLAAYGTVLAQGHGFTQSFTEHGFVIGLISVRADLTYQQGILKMWNRGTRYDYYFPAFAMLGEQAVLNREIYATGEAADAAVFGYQERWAEYRYDPSLITGKFRSTAAGTLDAWHLAQKFTTLPTLANTFIEDRPPVSRVVAAGEQADGQQFIADMFFDVKAARPLPLYSVPGLIDHF